MTPRSNSERPVAMKLSILVLPFALLPSLSQADGQAFHPEMAIKQVMGTKKFKESRGAKLVIWGQRFVREAKEIPARASSQGDSAQHKVEARSVGADPDYNHTMIETHGVEDKSAVIKQILRGDLWPVVNRLENLLRDREFAFELGWERWVLAECYTRLGLNEEMVGLYKVSGPHYNIEPYLIMALTNLKQEVPGALDLLNERTRAYSGSYKDSPAVIQSFMPIRSDRLAIAKSVALLLGTTGGLPEFAPYWADKGLRLDPTNPRLCLARASQYLEGHEPAKARSICAKGVSRAVGRLKSDLQGMLDRTSAH